MNKKKIDEMIPNAVKVLEEVGIANDGKIKKTFRGQISTFGAAVTNGSIISAVAFFSERGGAAEDRTKLLKAINILISEGDSNISLFDYVKNKGKDKQRAVKDEILNAAIALKLAMNIYELV